MYVFREYIILTIANRDSTQPKHAELIFVNSLLILGYVGRAICESCVRVQVADSKCLSF